MCRKIFLSVIILIFVLLAYLPAMQSGFVWDDDFHFIDNPYMTKSDGIKLIWSTPRAMYYPLTSTTWWFLRQIFNLNPLPYHLINILLHAANAILIFFILNYLGISGAWFAAVLFGIHPVNVESVAWVTELKNTQSGFFYFLAILLFLKYFVVKKQKFTKKNTANSSLLYISSALFFIMAILSKTSTVMLPFVLLFLIWIKFKKLTFNVILSTIPFFVFSALASLWTIWEQKIHSGAEGVEWSLNIIEKLIISGKIIFFYIGKLIWPYPLMFIYPKWNINSHLITSYIPLLLLIIVLILTYIFRNKWAKSFFSALLYFIISLFPVLGFFNIYFMRYSYVADHFQYLGCISIICLFSVGFMKIIKIKNYKFYFGQTVACIVLIILSYLTFNQCKIYNNIETLWLDTIAKNPQAWMAYTNLANFYRDNGKREEAIILYNKVIEKKPDYAEAYYNLGVLYYKIGKIEDALFYYKKSIEIKPTYKVYNNLGIIYKEKNDISAAIDSFLVAIEIEPNEAAYNNLATIYKSSGNVIKAVYCYKKALEINCKNADIHNNLAVLYFDNKQYSLAIKHCDKAIELGCKPHPDFLKELNRCSQIIR